MNQSVRQFDRFRARQYLRPVGVALPGIVSETHPVEIQHLRPLGEAVAVVVEFHPNGSSREVSGNGSGNNRVAGDFVR